MSNRFVAIPVGEVDETLRWPGVEYVASAPSFVSGLAIIRGRPTPVIDGGVFFGARVEARSGRLVVLRVGERRAALAVDAVVGLRRVPEGSLHELPPLMNQANTDVIEAIGTLDAALLLVLRAGRLLPESVWETLGGGSA